MSCQTGEKLSALVVGATGAVGKHVLRELLVSESWSRVGEAGRRLTPLEELRRVVLPPSASNEGRGRLEEKFVQMKVDYEKLMSELGEPGLDSAKGKGPGAEGEGEETRKLREGKWDVVFITLGTTRKDAGSAAAFERIDRGYVVAAATASKDPDPAHKQRLVYCSSMGVSTDSSLLYSRSKGLTEAYLAELGYSDTIIFRPGMLLHRDRSDTRIAEVLAQPVVKVATLISDNVGIDTSVLAKSMIRAALLGTAHLPQAVGASHARVPSSGASYTIIGNRGALMLAREKE